MSEVGGVRAQQQIREELLRRNEVLAAFVQEQAPRLTRACEEMARRFLDGGRLLAFGRGAAATDAQHVAVEFVHPVIVGKRALPALDLGPGFSSLLPVLVRAHDMVMGFAFPERDAVVEASLATASKAGALTFAMAGEEAEYAFSCPDEDPFVIQEVFEVVYHVLWETVHVFIEHRQQGHDVGASAFLYPFLGKREQSLEGAAEQVLASMQAKAAEVNRLRTAVADSGSATVTEAAGTIREQLARGGKVIAFGNGGSATDANDLALDCVMPPSGLKPVPAISLAAEPAQVTAVANDIGSDAIFARQLIAHAQPEDVAVAFSTSGSSPNLLAALTEARKRGLLTAGFAGYDGGKMVRDGLVDHALVVPSDHVPRIQEVQASLYHVLRRRM